ncbi:threonine--tRNA ligase [candidate division WOR-3 bacterium]|nr:threonine--tRNA ligase [candidate division WOR-3 bacterium]
MRVTVEGKERSVEDGKLIADLFEDRSVLAARLNGRLVDLSAPLEDGAEVEPVRFDTEEGRDLYWHSASHLMAQAVKQLFPEARVAIGPAVPEGFYYDFEVPKPFTEQDLARIEKRMKKLSQQRVRVEHRWLGREEALELFRSRGENYKVELIENLPDERISVYQQGDFVDLCRGPHVADTGRIKAIKLLSVAGAYWHGDEKNPMLSRIYGVAFPSQEQLDEHLARLEEAKRRDHRKLGVALDLFSFHEEAGAGLMFWHPKGAVLWRMIEQYWVKEHLAAGYQLIRTPQIARGHLWETSGHYAHYRENMYTLMVDEEEYVLKPMNCPGHMLIYKTRVHSYRDLPLRLTEWGTVHRYERSGTLHGAMRVRGFTQDDAHIFCTAEQVESVVREVVELSLKILRGFGFEEFRIDLSVRDPNHAEKYFGTDEQWQMAEGVLHKVLQDIGLPFHRAEGEAVFYGPKIDIKLVDALGREWQCPTCQFDFNLGERFNLRYTGEDGQHHGVFLVHRTVLGAIERFVGILTEHYGGAFPTWLAPVQARVMAVTDAQNDYARQVYDRLQQRNLRVEIDARSDKIGYKIAEAERMKVPWMLIVGAREAEAGTVSVRRHGRGDLGPQPVERAMESILEEVAVP